MPALTTIALSTLAVGTLGAIAKGTGMLDGPDIPKPPKPEAPVEKGDEGIRSGEMARQSKRRALGQAYLTRGQTRGTGDTLGSVKQTLG